MNWHPLAEVFPPLEGKDFEALKASIKATGGNQTNPIFYRMKDGQMEGLDGRNRYRACKELRLKPTMKKVSVKDDEAEDFILRQNEIRRHNSPDVRQSLVVEFRKRGDSLREIAEKLRVSPSTVRGDLAGAQKSTPEVVTGRDGKKYKPTQGDAGEDSILCDRCRRVGPTKGCPKCKRKAERAANKKGTRRGPQKNGQLPFDMTPFHHHFGGLVRQIVALGKRYGRKDSPEAKKLEGDLAAFKESFIDWRQEITKGVTS